MMSNGIKMMSKSAQKTDRILIRGYGLFLLDIKILIFFIEMLSFCFCSQGKKALAIVILYIFDMH